jgi:hypothetical protein
MISKKLLTETVIDEFSVKILLKKSNKFTKLDDNNEKRSEKSVKK